MHDCVRVVCAFVYVCVYVYLCVQVSVYVRMYVCMFVSAYAYLGSVYVCESVPVVCAYVCV